MVFKIPIEKYEKYRYLFNKENCPETFLESAFEYKIIPLFVDNKENPTIAYLNYAFAIFLVGNPNSENVSSVLESIPERVGIFAKGTKWEKKLREYYGENLLEIKRTKLSHKNLTLEKIKKQEKKLPEGYKLEKVDLKTLEEMEPILNAHIVMMYGNNKNFFDKGIGFCVKHEERAVSMASAFFSFTDKLEIQVSTIDSPDYRRKGLGTAASLALIKYCLENNIEPHWDAANEASVQMALKIGYTDPESYKIYAWMKNR